MTIAIENTSAKSAKARNATVMTITGESKKAEFVSPWVEVCDETNERVLLVQKDLVPLAEAILGSPELDCFLEIGFTETKKVRVEMEATAMDIFVEYCIPTITDEWEIAASVSVLCNDEGKRCLHILRNSISFPMSDYKKVLKLVKSLDD